MTNDLLTILRFWMKWVWNFATCIYFPGTNVTPASMVLFGIAAGIGIRFIKDTFGAGSSSGEKKE